MSPGWWVVSLAVIAAVVTALWIVRVSVKRSQARRRMDTREATALVARQALRDLRKQADKRDHARKTDTVGIDNGSNESAARNWGDGGGMGF